VLGPIASKLFNHKGFAELTACPGVGPARELISYSIRSVITMIAVLTGSSGPLPETIRQQLRVGQARPREYCRLFRDRGDLAELLSNKKPAPATRRGLVDLAEAGVSSYWLQPLLQPCSFPSSLSF